ncbi:Ty3/gypsy retrotransposon protein [Sesbania bispinosa]|nr:Ty3/gypsy retrotransposon protein [Sesbania bispinosa]
MGEVSNVSVGQRMRNDKQSDPQDEPMVHPSAPSARTSPFPTPKSDAPAFAPSQAGRVPLDGNLLSPARSEPPKESTIHVIVPSTPKDAPGSSDRALSPPKQSQPMDGDMIRVLPQDSSNLVDKVFTKGGGIVSNSELGLDRPKRSIRKPSWMKDFI